MSKLAQIIERQVTNAVADDELDLPTLPEVALRIRDAAESESVSANSLQRVIAEDPGLSGQMIKMANSPMFRATRAIDDLGMALSRLGVEYAANLATGLAMQQMFQATSEIIDRKLRSVWSKATEIAAISGVLAKSFTSLRPDQATLAGLTHSIGVLPILSWAEHNSDLLSDSMTLDRVIDSIHGSLGTMILQSWEFPPELALVPASHTDFTRKAENADYIDVVTVAVLQNLAGTSHPYTEMDWNEIHAFHNLGLDPDMESKELEEINEEIEEAKTAFL
ncbi:MAG: HDOD domain-containing protein [Gammaproteobacteria bacterium]|nr:HDOD domain-containing protein [Gammaproteobacteria bacterium]